MDAAITSLFQGEGIVSRPNLQSRDHVSGRDHWTCLACAAFPVPVIVPTRPDVRRDLRQLRRRTEPGHLRGAPYDATGVGCTPQPRRQPVPRPARGARIGRRPLPAVTSSPRMGNVRSLPRGGKHQAPVLCAQGRAGFPNLAHRTAYDHQT